MNIRISDHAITRYIERKIGITRQQIVTALITPEMKDVVAAMHGTCRYQVNELTYVFEDYVLVTILESRMRDFSAKQMQKKRKSKYKKSKRNDNTSSTS